ACAICRCRTLLAHPDTHPSHPAGRTLIGVWQAEGDGEGQDRTGDTTIFSRVLYQLSYLAGRRTVYRPGVPTREGATASGTVLPLREGRCDPLHHSTFSAPGQVTSPYSFGARSMAISTPTSAAVSSAAFP